jgi:hypothetical protein
MLTAYAESVIEPHSVMLSVAEGSASSVRQTHGGCNDYTPNYFPAQ